MIIPTTADLVAIAPEIVLTVAAALALLIDAFTPGWRRLLAPVTMAAATALGPAMFGPSPSPGSGQGRISQPAQASSRSRGRSSGGSSMIFERIRRDRSVQPSCTRSSSAAPPV